MLKKVKVMLLMVIGLITLTGCQETYHIAPDGSDPLEEEMSVPNYREKIEGEECIECA